MNLRNERHPFLMPKPLRQRRRRCTRRLELELLEKRIQPSADFRSIDGTGNNLAHLAWGSAGTDLLRLAPAAYADGVSATAGADRPSPRVISNTIADQGDQDILNDRQMSA